MDYEKAYKEALERARDSFTYPDYPGFIRADVVFPELKESENELTWLTNYIREEAYYLSIDIRDDEDRIKLKKLQKAIAWLEKQGELKSSKWTEGDVVRHGDVLALVTNGRRAMKSNYEYITIQYPDEWIKADTKERKYFFDEIEKQGEQKPDNDKEKLDVLNFIRKEACCGLAEANNALLKLIKVLKEHPFPIMDKPHKLEIEWEEQQDEQEPANKVKPKFKVKYAVGEYNVVDEKDIAGVTYYGIEDEPNHIDYVKADTCEIINAKPKFKAGDWICNVISLRNISSIENGMYSFDEGDVMPIEFVDKYYNLWTINDAEEGDVVVDKSNEVIGIFQSIGHHPDGGSYNDPSYCFLHCRYDNGFFYADFENGNMIESDDLIPATKEQRDLLFQEMLEAGYKWNSEKKELKKVIIEPKFKVGDWIVWQDKCYKVNYNGCGYELVDQNGLSTSLEYGTIDENAHLWTIQYAKDGDVLLFEGYYNSIVLFQGIGINGKGRINYHCKCDLGNYSFGIQGDVACLGTIEKDAENYHPATKEQRDTLFARMKEAGYEWDTKNKELKKIETKGGDK